MAVVRRGRTSRKFLGKRTVLFNPQGTGRAVARAFGTGGKQPKKKTKQQPAIVACPKLHPRVWDAFDSSHAALPRSVGPYTVVKTTMIHKTTAKSIMVGTFVDNKASATVNPCWSNYVIAESAGSDSHVIGSDGGTKFFGIPPPGEPAYATSSTNQCCPAAISVQVMGNKSLNSAQGQLAAAVVPANMDLRGSTKTWPEIQAQFISYFRPRLLSGGKLALRGVQMNSHPLNMADVSDFRPMHSNADITVGVPWSTASAVAPEGWAPMFIANPDQSDITLLVTVEWRVRFNIGNPAASSHQHHGVTSDRTWDDHIRAAVKVLPGVLDIVENVAQRGMAMKAAYSAIAA